MTKAAGIVVVLTGAAVGLFVLLCSDDAGVVAPRRQSSDVPDPAPAAEKAIVQDVIAVPAAGPAKALSLADAPARVPVGQHMPSPELRFARTRLTRELQFQLKRVGCYDGQIDGVWSPAVRTSMKAFTDRVNAVLPVEQPDVILLALLQNHQGGACGLPCPAGQSLAADGRCLPNILITNAAKKQAPAGTTHPEMVWPSVDDVFSSDPPPAAREGKEPRMALAGPSLPPAASPGQPTDAPAQAGSPGASARVRTPTSRRFPAWAAHAFESW